MSLPQFDPTTPALSQTQVGKASTVVANTGVFVQAPVQEEMLDATAQRLLQETFGAASSTAHGLTYEQLRPAYALGWQSAIENPTVTWNVLQRHLPAYWETHAAARQHAWSAVQTAVQAGWALALAQPLNAQAQAAQLQRTEAVNELLSPLIRECNALVCDVQALLALSMQAFPYQVLQRHVNMLEGFAQEMQWLANGVEVSRPQRLGWWLRQRSAWLLFQGQVADWQYTDVMLLCEQREQQLLCSYRSATTARHSRIVRQVLLHQQHDLQRNMEKLCWVRTHWLD